MFTYFAIFDTFSKKKSKRKVYIQSFSTCLTT